MRSAAFPFFLRAEWQGAAHLQRLLGRHYQFRPREGLVGPLARSQRGRPHGKRSGLLVLDVDPRNGGPQSLVALERENVPLPSTARSLTAAGACTSSSGTRWGEGGL